MINIIMHTTTYIPYIPAANFRVEMHNGRIWVMKSPFMSSHLNIVVEAAASFIKC